MRFYLDTGTPGEVRAAAALPHVAGFTTNPSLLARAGSPDARGLLAAALESGRRDFRAFVQAGGATATETLAEVDALEAWFFGETGGEWAGPTLVHKLVPTPEALWAAARVAGRGKEVCITGIASPLQALAVATLPPLPKGGPASPAGSGFQAEGPPGSRTPPRPHSVAFYVGRVSDSGRDGVQEVADTCAALAACGGKVRVLAASIRSRDMAAEVLRRVLAAGPGALALLDLTLPAAILADALSDPVTSAALEEFRSCARSRQ